MKRFVHYLRLWMGYQRRGFLEMTQYPADTVIMVISLLLREASGFIGTQPTGTSRWGRHSPASLRASRI